MTTRTHQEPRATRHPTLADLAFRKPVQSIAIDNLQSARAPPDATALTPKPNAPTSSTNAKRHHLLVDGSTCDMPTPRLVHTYPAQPPEHRQPRLRCRTPKSSVCAGRGPPRTGRRQPWPPDAAAPGHVRPKTVGRDQPHGPNRPLRSTTETPWSTTP